MENQLFFNIINLWTATHLLQLAVSICIVLMISSLRKKIKVSNKYSQYTETQAYATQQSIKENHQDTIVKLSMIHETLKNMHSDLKVIESKIGDLTMRVNIAEVRLEERKPQQFMIPQQIPSISQAAITNQPRKPGRPKSNPQ